MGWPQWLTIIAMIGALLLTFKVMARASIAYEKKRREREAAGQPEPGPDSVERKS